VANCRDITEPFFVSIWMCVLAVPPGDLKWPSVLCDSYADLHLTWMWAPDIEVDLVVDKGELVNYGY
jgi:hypothetical protein